MNRNNNNVGCGGHFFVALFSFVFACIIGTFNSMDGFWVIGVSIFLYFFIMCVCVAMYVQDARYESLLKQLRQDPYNSDTQKSILNEGRGMNYTEERIRNDIDAATAASKKPTHSAPNVAAEIEKLGKLFLDGVLTAAEFERGKTLFLGNPPDKAQAATKLLSELHQLHKRGALSESEFNSKKWDILAGKLI